MENKTDNELIAKFMGGRECVMYVKDVGNLIGYEFDDYDDTNRYLIEYLKYDISWDWLMPVVEKIESLGKVTVIICACPGEYHCRIGIGETSVISETKISAVYKAAVNFIQKYNNHGK